MIISPHKDNHLLAMPGTLGDGNFAKLSALPGYSKWQDRNLIFRVTGENIRHFMTHWPDAEWIGGAEEHKATYTALQAKAEEIIKTKNDDGFMPDVSDYRFEREPMDHQRKAFGISRDADSFGLFMEQGCVDRDTEYLSPEGWVKISEYKGGMVAQYHPETGVADFVEPNEFVVLPCKEFYWFHHQYGLDQMLSKEHRMLIHHKAPSRNVKNPWINRVWKSIPTGKSLCETTVEQLVNRMPSASEYRKLTFPNSFSLKKENGLPYSQAQVRLQVAFNADGSYNSKDLSGMTDQRHGYIRIKKARKKIRLTSLLELSKTEYTRKEVADGFSVFKFKPPMVLVKDYSSFWGASQYQMEIILDECKYWDGTIRKSGFSFFSRHRVDVDFIQLCASANGRRSKLTGNKGEWMVHIAGEKTPLTNLSQPEIIKSKDSKKYCFRVPTTCLVFRRNGCVFCSGNTGKSKVTIDTGCYLYGKGKIDAMIVVAWPNGVHRNWIDYELPEDMSVPYVADYWSSNYSAKYRQEDYKKILNAKGVFRVFGFNVEAFVGKSAREMILKMLTQWRCLLVIDQSASIKNPQAIRTKFLIDKCSRVAAYRRVLDGAPVAEGADELYSQFKFLDPKIIGHDTWTGFKAEFCVIGFFNEISGYRNMDELRRRIDGHCYRVLADDCLDLPTRIYKVWPFDLSPREAEIFDDLKGKDLAFFKPPKDKDELEDLDGHEHLEEHRALIKNLRLQQIASGWWPGEEFKMIEEDGMTSRVKALLTLLEQAPGKALIFSRFRADLDIIQTILGKKAVSYHGGISEEDRATAKKKFMTDPKTLYFVGQPRSAGIGHTLTAAHHVIFFSNDASLRMREECEKRAHRKGLKNKLIIWDLIARGTHDMKIVKALREKKEIANMIMQDPKNFFLCHEKAT